MRAKLDYFVKIKPPISQIFTDRTPQYKTRFFATLKRCAPRKSIGAKLFFLEKS